MAGRKPKSGLDFWSCDVDIFSDTKFTIAQRKFGMQLTMCVYLLLLNKIYSDKGYYLEYDDDNKQWAVCNKICQALSGKYAPTAETVGEVIAALADGGLFDADCFKAGLITSKRIQETYYRATVERVIPSIRKDIWLLSVPEMEAISTGSKILTFFNLSGEKLNLSDEKSNLSGEKYTENKTVNNNTIQNSIVHDDENKGIKMPDISNFHFSSSITETINNWIEYSTENSRPIPKAGILAICKSIKKALGEYSEEEVTALIDETITRGWVSIPWDRLAKRREWSAAENWNVAENQIMSDGGGFGLYGGTAQMSEVERRLIEKYNT